MSASNAPFHRTTSTEPTTAPLGTPFDLAHHPTDGHTELRPVDETTHTGALLSTTAPAEVRQHPPTSTRWAAHRTDRLHEEAQTAVGAPALTVPQARERAPHGAEVPA